MIARFTALLALTLLPAAADPLLPPHEAVKKFTAPEGFSVDLIAAEPAVVQPIAFCWDAKGRIWVVEGRTYPTRRGNPPKGTATTPAEAQLKDIFAGDDRILIFADEDGDGKFESRKVFADKLNLVSGIELGFGGVYVGAAPYLLHIPDKDGDDKPDGPPEILLDGWGWQDTHETLNSFIWGPDGWLYGCHGVFTHSHVGAPGTPKEKRTPLNCGYWRYHPVKKTFEVFAHGTSNSWGFDYNEYGDWFSEACVIPHFWHIIQGGYYLRQSNPLGHFNPYVYTNIETIADHLHYIGTTPHSGNGVSDESGGGHAHCGLCIYNGDNFPPEYRGRALMFNIHGQRINQEQLVPDGSGYVAKHLPDFVKANDKNFTGVALKVGPDGAVYFIDWYDMQKCHRPQPEVWDRSNGRIYRVKYNKTWKPWKGDVGKLTTDGLIALHAHQNEWFHRTARRLITERSGNMALLEEYLSIAAAIRFPEFKIEGVKFGDALARWEDQVRKFDQRKAKGLGFRNRVGETGVKISLDLKNVSALFVLETLCEKAGAEITGEGTEEGGPPIIRATGPATTKLREAMDATMSRFAALLTISASKPFYGELFRELLKSNDPHSRAYAVRILAGSAPENYTELTKEEQSPRVRLALASALQRLPLADRWPVAEALIAHEEDATDHNLPQMYWYAIEPLVPADPVRALALATKSQIPLISQHILRRLSETDSGLPHLIAALGTEKTPAGAAWLLKAALNGLRGRNGATAPAGWDSAWANLDTIIARNPDAKPLTTEISDLREALAVAFGDKRSFPRLRAQVRDTTLPGVRRELALQTLLDGRDPEIPSLILLLLDDPALRLAALRALPRATGR